MGGLVCRVAGLLGLMGGLPTTGGLTMDDTNGFIVQALKYSTPYSGSV